MRRSISTSWGLPADRPSLVIAAFAGMTATDTHAWLILQARFHSRLDEIDAEAWNALLPDDNPFLAHAFLSGLERTAAFARSTAGARIISPCTTMESSSPPRRCTSSAIRTASTCSTGRGPAPTNAPASTTTRSCSARCPTRRSPARACWSASRCGRTGPARSSGRRQSSRQSKARTCRRHISISSTAPMRKRSLDAGWLARFDWQFHWTNAPVERGGWRDFDEFLAALTHKKRKNIRHERAQVARAGITCELRHGDEIGAGDWRANPRAVSAHVRRARQSSGADARFLPPSRRAHAAPGDRRAVQTRRRRSSRWPCCCARPTTLYGRYWGCRENVPGLHFEACYYQGIDYCLRHGLTTLRTRRAGRAQDSRAGFCRR